VQRIDLSHPIVPGMKTYPGLPTPEAHVVVDYEASRARYEGKAEFLNASLHLCGNTGTCVDAPILHDRGRPPKPPAAGAGSSFAANLASVPRDGGFLHAAPIPWVGGATFPVRASSSWDSC
jgi:kynurenine formamidase